MSVSSFSPSAFCQPPGPSTSGPFSTAFRLRCLHCQGLSSNRHPAASMWFPGHVSASRFCPRFRLPAAVPALGCSSHIPVLARKAHWLPAPFGSRFAVGTGTCTAASPPCQPLFLSFPISLWGQIQTLPDAPRHSLQVFVFVPPPPEDTHARFSPSQTAAFCFFLPDLGMCCSLCFFPSVPSSLSFTTLLGSVPWCPRQLVTSRSAVAHCMSSSL